MNNQQVFLFGYHDSKRERLAIEVDGTTYALSQFAPSIDTLLQTVRASDLIEQLLSYQEEEIEIEQASLSGLIEHSEVWAAGITYKKSEELHAQASVTDGVYTEVYDAERPELFFKGAGYNISSNYDPVGIREDAQQTAPEPELTIIVNGFKEVVGFTIGNDMSSRDIEKVNPLYLSQAKVYDGSCAIGPRIWIQPNATDYPQTDIRLEIYRQQDMLFESVISTSSLQRDMGTLLDYLGRSKTFRYGCFLMTGTGIITPDEYSLQVGDEIHITIEPIGTLVNPVKLV